MELATFKYFVVKIDFVLLYWTCQGYNPTKIIKINMEVFPMETKTTIQFDVLDTQMLASIEGGTASAGEVCTLAGAMIGSLVAPRAGT